MKHWTGIALLLLLMSCQSKHRGMLSFSEALDSLLVQEFHPDEPGAALLVKKGNRVVFSKGYGLADMQTHTPITDQTLFNLGSISKTFVANAILLLEQEGMLSTEDPLSKFFPSFKSKSIADQVKIKHLLTHTSGLPDNRNVAGDSVFFLTAKDAENFFPVTQADSLLFEPGTRFEYSNPAFNGLALIIEKASGQPWQQFVKSRIFDVAKMTISTITNGPYPESGVAHAYYNRGDQWVEDDYGEEPTFPAAGNGGVWSSLAELATFEEAIRQAIFLDSARIIQSRTPQNKLEVHVLTPLDDRPWSIGWAWFISQVPGEPTLVGHAGTQGGFYCNYISIPEKDLLFVLLSNRPSDREGITRWVLNRLKNDNWLDD